MFRSNDTPIPLRDKPTRMCVAVACLLFGCSSDPADPTLAWESMDGAEVQRLSVPTGWLVRDRWRGMFVFVPDPEHEWRPR